MTAQNTSPLTHFDADGQAHMVDVGAKTESRRVAVATGRIVMLPDTFAMVKSGSAKKGDVLLEHDRRAVLNDEPFNLPKDR